MTTFLAVAATLFLTWSYLTKTYKNALKVQTRKAYCKGYDDGLRLMDDMSDMYNDLYDTAPVYETDYNGQVVDHIWRVDSVE